MGHTTEPNGTISFQPDNTPDVLHIASYGMLDLSSLLDQCKEHFGEDISLDDLIIAAEHIHTRCLRYDQYDGGDYDNFLVISRKA